MPQITKAQQQKFIADLNRAKKESDAQIVYRNLFDTFYGDQVKIITEEHGTDIIAESVNYLFYNLKLLAEIKYKLDFTALKTERAKVVAQIIYYLHKIRAAGERLPNILVAADKNEIFILYGPKLYGYLDRNYDWKISPSEAHKYNLDLFNELLEDPNLDIFVNNLQSSNFDLNYIFKLIDELLNLNGQFKTIEVSRQSLLRIFEDFNKNVFGGMAVDSKIKMQILFNKFLNNGKVYLHPQKKDTVCIITSSKKITEYPINAGQFEAFFSQFNIKNDLKIYKELTEIADTLFEDISRRFTGDFWTPKIWVDKAHEMIASQLGADWKERYIVWDAAAGAKNLTRDYKFPKSTPCGLFCSTLHEEEIAISDMYNPEATTFQYDFLNDDIWLHTGDRNIEDNLKMPVELLNALKAKRPIVFFMNPPYGSNGDNTLSIGIDKSKIGIQNTKICKIMKENNVGDKASAELYCQFIYRVQLIAKTFNYDKDLLSFFFYNKGFLTSPGYANFTNDLCRQFSFEKGFMFNAGEFHGTSSAWGIIFSHWKIAPNNIPPTEFKFDVLERNNNEIVKKCEWIGKTVQKEDTLTNWLKEIPVPKENQVDYPVVVSGFDNPKGKNKYGNYKRNAFGCMQIHGSNVQFSDKYLWLQSAMDYNGLNSWSVVAENFERASVSFAVRKSALEIFREQGLLWVRDKDIFRRPSETLQQSQGWKKFVTDCVVYSLFANGSNQTSLRDYEYNGKRYRVNNEFFWLSLSEINALAIKSGNMAVQIDADGDTERFAYKWLHETSDASAAQSLLAFATELLIESFSLRDTYCKIHPKYNLNSWDVGWLQIYKMIFSNDRINDAFKSRQAEFKRRLNALGKEIYSTAAHDNMI